MYLKSIEVQGFKSFANKIKFEFHNGITGIVGPNGSGKSNVADAVRWVLGEQSAKQLRGGNMQDVIFSGTQLRKPLGYASVAITLDNADHKLDTSYEEVTVTRRLYRSGESEYLMNGAACRLRDIQELFYDTGIGKEGYSIIGQGQIDKILSNKPDDRRELFDEAAGIVKFKRRKATTLKKLEEEESNLTRVSDILSELTRQLGPLRRQSESARIYLKKRDELKLLDLNMFLVDRERMEKEYDRLQQTYGASSEELAETKAQFEKTKEEYDVLEKQLEELEKEIEEKREKTSGNALSLKQLEGQIQVLQEQIRTASENRRMHAERLDAIDSECEGKKAQLKELEQTRDEAKIQGKENQTETDRIQFELDTLHDAMVQSTLTMNQAKTSQIDLLNQKASAKGKLQRYDAMLEQIGIRKSMLSQRVLVLKNDEEKQQDVLINCRAEYRKLAKEIEGADGKRSANQKQIEKLQQEIVNEQREVDNRQLLFHREESRLETLRNMSERYDGYGNSIRRVMEQKSRVPGLIGVVADLIKTDKKYETAIETALGGAIQNIVTKDEKTAKEMIGFLKKNRYGRATFLPLSAISAKSGLPMAQLLKEEGVIQSADRLVHTEPEFAELMRSLLGRTLVVETIDHGIALQKKNHHSLRIVTLEGELLNPGGSMTGGAFKNTSNLLGRRREIEELEKQVKKLSTDLDELKQGLETKRTLRNALRDEIADIAEKVKDKQLDLNTAEMSIRQAEQRIREIQSGYSQLKGESSEIESQIREIDEFKLSIQKEMKELKSSEKDSQETALSQETLLNQQKDQETELAKQLESLHLKGSELSQQLSFHEENITRIRRELETLQAEKEDISGKQTERSHEEEEKKQQMAEIEATMAAGREQDGILQAELAKTQQEKEKLQGTHRQFFAKRDELSEHQNRLDKECYRLRSQLDKLEESQESQINYIWDEYEITPVQAASYRMEEVPERTVLKKQLNEVKEEIRRLGPVNVNAIEEFKEVEERHTFLSAQHEDLIQAKETLENIIQELDDGMRRQFSEKFADIQREFDKAFKDLFGGGKGSIELVEGEDILEAGVQIISQPPGKKLQNMMQLSGGEKALTAIALLFAIQNLKPSPFCLLDEIEAALDDSNVTRFAEYLHKLTKNTQFIVITHRRGTMNAADRLYGITMQEKGVSTLVSVDLIEDDLDK